MEEIGDPTIQLNIQRKPVKKSVALSTVDGKKQETKRTFKGKCHWCLKVGLLLHECLR